MTGAVVLLLVTIPATREGRGPWTWWAHKRAERAQRLLDRPVPTAEERFARGFSLRRLLGVVLHALPCRRRRSVPRFVTPGEHTSKPRTQSAPAGSHAPAAPVEEAKTGEPAVSVMAPAATAACSPSAKGEIPRPQVIEADPIDTDIVNPRILARS